MGSLRGGVGASPPARGSTPAPRPKLVGLSLLDIAINEDIGFRCPLA